MKTFLQNEKNSSVIFFFFVFIIFFSFLQITCKFQFYYIEQYQLFQYTLSYVLETLFQPGGFTIVLSEFLVQFFFYPYIGALVTTLLLTGISILTYRIFKQMLPFSHLWGLSLIPSVTLMFMHFDFNYELSGTIAYLFMLLSIYYAIRIKNFRKRVFIHLIIVVLLFCISGSIFILYILSSVIYELSNNAVRYYFVFLILILTEVLLIGVLNYCIPFYGEYRFFILPDAYYQMRIHPQSVIYYSWVAFPLIMLLVYIFRKKIVEKKRKETIVGLMFQLLFVFILAYWGIYKYKDNEVDFLKELDYYARTEQWNKITERCKGVLDGDLYVCYLNLALAQENELDTMFDYDQRGTDRLIPQWNGATYLSLLLSDIFFSMSHIAASQHMAFESYVGTTRMGNPRALKRLVQTNLIYGNYEVAKKYIHILEKSFTYKDWAKKHRDYLYNDVMIEKDLLLGTKRNSLLRTNHLSMINGLESELASIADNNPSDDAPISYLCSYLLLNKDVMNFQLIIDWYYGMEALPQLPICYQEAMFFLWENNKEHWKTIPVLADVNKRYFEFKKELEANMNDNTSGKMKQLYGNTYWYYYMFK